MAEYSEVGMSCKVKNLIIRIITYLLSGLGMAAILIFQYFTIKNPMPTWAKVTVPILIALLVAFLVYYKAIKEKINRKLIAIETAKEIGKAGETNSIVSSLLETIGVVIPLALIGMLIMGIILMFSFSSTAYLIYSIIGIALFMIITTYDIHIIKRMYYSVNSANEQNAVAIYGALQLYLDFINIFLHLLALFAKNRD